MNNREAFFNSLMELAEKDDKIILVIADVGFSYIDKYIEKFPKQFLNVGVCEQAGMGICAGLALAGFKPYFYSMINFSLMRCYEQVRNDVCFHDANVKIIGVKGSEAYKFLGMSHNLEGDEHEDKLLIQLPNITTSYPDSAEQTAIDIKATYNLQKPAYIRL